MQTHAMVGEKPHAEAFSNNCPSLIGDIEIFLAVVESLHCAAERHLRAIDSVKKAFYMSFYINRFETITCS